MDQSFSPPLGNQNTPPVQTGGQGSAVSPGQMPEMANPFTPETQGATPVVSPLMQNVESPQVPVVQEVTQEAFYEEPKKSRSLLSLFFVFLFIAVTAFTGYLWYVRDTETNNNDRLLRSVDTIEQSIRDLQLKQNVSYQVAAGDILLKAQGQRINWSRIVDLILQYETVNIEFVNFSSNKDQQVFVTGKANSYEHIATLIDSFNGNSLIDAPFVSSITKREQRSSRSSRVAGPELERNTVGFQLTFSYKAAKPTPQ